MSESNTEQAIQYPIPMRMSGAGHCPRRIAYRSLGYEESNLPDRASTIRLELGNTAEKLLIEYIREDGWTTTNTVLEENGQLELIDPALPLTGHPDGICSHPEFTGNYRLPLECKSMYAHRREEIEERGVFATYPYYKAQIACYGANLYRAGLVAHPYRGVFACTDRDGEMITPERVSWEPEYTRALFQNLSETWDTITAGKLPDKPYEPGAEECKYCNFYTLCHGVSKAPEKVVQPVWVEPDEDVRIATLYHNGVKQRLESISRKNEGADVRSGTLIAGFFVPRNDSYDHHKLTKFLTAEQLRQCRDTAQPRFWIRSRQ